jgi:hypothetical protein
VAQQPSPRRPTESSRQYQRLLDGRISSKEYVKSLKDEARSRVQNQRAQRRNGSG